MATTAERIPAAILTGDDILLEASQALAERDKLQAALRTPTTVCASCAASMRQPRAIGC